MSPTHCAETASNRDPQPILFGLLADGSDEARFACLRAAAFGGGPVSPELSRFSPSDDWYGRWAVRPLHGTLTPRAKRVESGVCPEDIVVLGPRHQARRS